MTLKLGVIMDSISTIKIKKDSTFAILLEAQARGWPIFYMEQKDLFLREGCVFAYARELHVQDNPECWFTFNKENVCALQELDVILMRKDPPVDVEYIHTTQLLDLVEQTGTLIVNKPQSLRDYNEKLFISWFPQCCVPTLVTHDKAQAREFLQAQEDIICKPIDGMGGRGIFRLTKSDPNINAVLEVLTQNNAAMLAQRFIPEISEGDKRILLINGEPIPYALARIPTPGENRANLAAGGRGVGVKLSKRDRWICEQVAPVLRKKGLLFVGIDVIGDYLTEINITSPTCIRELDHEFNLNISGKLLDDIATKICVEDFD